MKKITPRNAPFVLNGRLIIKFTADEVKQIILDALYQDTEIPSDVELECSSAKFIQPLHND